MRRQRNAKIVATLGPASSSPEKIKALFDMFRLNYGVMIARGDLGVEMPPEEVPVVQRQVIRACHREGGRSL